MVKNLTSLWKDSKPNGGSHSVWVPSMDATYQLLHLLLTRQIITIGKGGGTPYSYKELLIIYTVLLTVM